MPRTKRSLKGDGETKEQRKAKSAEVIRLHLQGRTVEEIAAETETNKARVANIIANRRRQVEGLLDQRAVRAATTDAALAARDAMVEQMLQGDATAAKAFLAANDQIARLHGAYAASKHMHGFKKIEDMTEDELLAFLGQDQADGDSG